ncbi:MAG TPA: hypothetical protein VK619_00150 [Pyrinomonadaceae bacterium]|nr:hypothetical protein [Pyrinomonadaceae bacterium]
MNHPRRIFMRTSVCVLLFAVCNLTLGLTNVFAQAWPQWGRDPQHTGSINVKGQNLNENLVNIVYDPLVPDEVAANDGDLLAHYQVPLVDGNNVYMEYKSGTYSINSYATQIWGENKFTWVGNQLVQAWSFQSDWKAPGSAFDFWEPVFHPALANGSIYIPAAGGTVYRVNPANGSVITRINPFGNNIDNNTYTASPISADSSGNIYYNVVRLHANDTDFYANDAQGSWLVKVTPGNATSKATYASLLSTTPGVPGGNDQCKAGFATPPPWPPSPDAVAPTTTCGSQRAALNIAPAIAPDGTIYTVSRGHFVTRYNYLIAVNSNLTPKWAASLRGLVNDGCNDGTNSSTSVLPLNGTPGGCSVGAHPGVVPDTNEPPPMRVLDDSSASPTVAPDGSVLFGAYTRYNWAQGHLLHFSSTGQFLGAFNFGWDITPGIYSHGGTYSVVTKNNHYGDVGSYCSDDTVCPPDRTATYPNNPEAYFITQLNQNLGIEWSFQNTNTLSCTRQPDGSVTCVSDHPNGFEWCVNQMLIDSKGIVYANSEDGNLFAINQGGTLKKKIFQQLALGAAYTPTSMDTSGRVYSQNAGHLFVAGN